MCNHDPNDDKATIILSNKWLGIYPRKIIGICKECHEKFEFIKENDKLILNR